MACSRSSLHEYLSNFSGSDPIDAVVCPFTQEAGAGMGLPLFSLIVISSLGLGLTVRTQHPGPIMVCGILSAGLFATSLPGIGAKIFALVMFFGISAVGLYIYQQAQTSL